MAGIDTTIAVLETALDNNPGVQTITVDGLAVSYNRGQLMAELSQLRRRKARQEGRRPACATIKVGL